MALDITALHNVSSEVIKEAARTAATNTPDKYKDICYERLLHKAIDNTNTTNN